MALLIGLRFTPGRFLLLSAVLLSLFLFAPQAFAGDEAVVNEAVVNLRASPNTSSEIVGKAVQGEKLEVQSRQGDWYRIKKGGLAGWVAGWLVTVSQTPEQPGDQGKEQAVVKEAIVNLRSLPNTTGEILGKAVQGEKLEVLSRQGDWYRVKKGNLACWVAGWLVTVGPAPENPGDKAAEKPLDQGPEQAVVKEATVNLRSLPNTSSEIVGKAVQGEKLEVLSSQGDWYRVKKGGLSCWVAGWLVDINRGPLSSGDPGPQAGDGANNPPAEEKTSYRAEATESGVNIRSGPGTGFKIIGQAGGGSQYDVLDKSGGWYKIPSGGGWGWISEQYVKITVTTASRGSVERSAPSGSGKAVVKGSEVNIRSGPGTNYNVVSSANKGDTLLLVDSAKDWYKVRTDNGGMGWVVAWLVDVDRPQAGTGQNSSKPVQSSGVVPAPTGEKPAQNTGTGPSSTSEKPGQNTGTVPGPTDPKTVEKGTGIVPPSLTPPPAPQKPVVASIKSVSARAEGDSTVVTVQSDGSKIKYSMTTVYDPDRLVVELSSLEPGPVPENINFTSSLVGGVRVGLYSKDPCVTRVVIDLKKGAKYDRILSTDGTQLNIKVMPRSARPLSGARIVLDPGHGGSDPGAIGATGLTEKSVNLDIAQKAAQILRNQGATVILTRTSDIYVDLYSRPEMASKNAADLFVSIHSNASPNRSAGGISTYFRRSDDGGMDQVRMESMYLSRNIQSSLLGTLKRQDQKVLQADFVVVVKSKVPAALAEVAFISNPEEEKLLADDSFRMKAAQAITQGIAGYLGAK